MVTDEMKQMKDPLFEVPVTLGFREYLKSLKASEDQWVSTCGVFLDRDRVCTSVAFLCWPLSGESIRNASECSQKMVGVINAKCR